MEQTENQFTTVQQGQVVLAVQSDYKRLPDGEPYKAHISAVETTQQPNYENPDQLDDVLVVRFKVDQGEGTGQVYTSWFKPSLHPKSKMHKMLVALYPKGIPKDDEGKFDIFDLNGLPLRIILTPGMEKNGKTRQYVEAYLRPADGQTRVEADSAPTEQDVEGLDVDAMFGDIPN